MVKIFPEFFWMRSFPVDFITLCAFEKSISIEEHILRDHITDCVLFTYFDELPVTAHASAQGVELLQFE